MGTDYAGTPSFYSNEEFFNRYLGRTSYYLGLQSVVDKLINLIKPKTVLELGAALGTTTVAMAKRHPQAEFRGSDLRADVVRKANESAMAQDNLSFFVEDMCDTAKQDLSGYDLIFLLYSFHHIEDPLGRKMEFLANCHRNMREGAYLLIAETFLPEELQGDREEQPIVDLWSVRSAEGYASTYWAALQDLSDDGLDFAKRVAQTSHDEESEAGSCVFRRDGEYLVKFSWLVDEAKRAGFEVVIAEPVNCLCEKALLLRKR